MKTTALEYLKHINLYGTIPLYFSKSNRDEMKNSNSELYSMLKDRAVLINGIYPLPSDEIETPIKQLMFFPNGKRKATML